MKLIIINKILGKNNNLVIAYKKCMQDNLFKHKIGYSNVRNNINLMSTTYNLGSLLKYVNNIIYRVYRQK